MNQLNDALSLVEVMRCYRDLHKVYGELLREIALAISHSAEVGLDSVDSRLLLVFLEKHNESIKAINHRLETVGANFGIGK